MKCLAVGLVDDKPNVSNIMLRPATIAVDGDSGDTWDWHNVSGWSWIAVTNGTEVDRGETIGKVEYAISEAIASLNLEG